MVINNQLKNNVCHVQYLDVSFVGAIIQNASNVNQGWSMIPFKNVDHVLRIANNVKQITQYVNYVMMVLDLPPLVSAQLVVLIVQIVMTIMPHVKNVLRVLFLQLDPAAFHV